jgi:predicted HTH transcriptional regulator
LEKNSLEVAKLLKSLTGVELLIAENRGRWTTYKLNTDFKTSLVGLPNGLSNGLPNGLSNSGQTTLQVFSLIQKNPHITRKELSEKIGISITSIQKHIDKLRLYGKIERGGSSTRGGYWIILPGKN